MTFRNLTVLMILPIVDEVRFCNRRNMHCILGISTVSITWCGDANSAKFGRDDSRLQWCNLVVL